MKGNVLLDAKEETAIPVMAIIEKNIVQASLMVVSGTIVWEIKPRDIGFALHHNAYVGVRPKDRLIGPSLPLALSMLECHIEHSKERSAKDRWQMLTSRQLYSNVSGRMPMSVKFVHINLSPSGAVCRKIMYAIAKIQISIKGAKKKKKKLMRTELMTSTADLLESKQMKFLTLQ